MNKKLTLITVMLLCLASMVIAQEIQIMTKGVSPRDADMAEDDIYDRAYNGLANVGVETKVFLSGMFVDSSFTSPVWAISVKPTGSAAALSVAEVVDASTQVVTLIPDVAGTYKITLTDGGMSGTITINAGTYLGIEDGKCNLCHKSTSDAWEMTGHFSLFEDAMNGLASDHYGESCISCHTTGYDLMADNNGFDDRDFVWPDSASLVDDFGSPDGHLFVGVYDSLLKFYPNSMKLARIQCESCHGPGSAHNSITSDAKMVSTLSSDNCAWCHDSGSHHIFPYQWDVSRHGNPLYAARGASPSCAPCHSGAGFVAWVKSGKTSLAEAPTVTAITCATCHDPHNNEIVHQLRTIDVTLENGEAITVGGLGKLCMNCHKSRNDAEEYTGPDFGYSSHYGPHHGPQAEILLGTNMPTFGKKIPSSAHMRIENACVDCHMAETDETDPAKMAGAHSFAMVSEEGVDNVEACVECHGEIGESFAEKKFYQDGTADHDGDGDEEGLQEEVEGLLYNLAMLLPPLDEDEVDIGGDYIYTQTEAKAAYNWFAVEEDRSLGIHNPAFVVGLLKVSIQAVTNNALNGDIVQIMDVPNDQGKMVNIIWNKMADDGVAIDPLAKYIVKRADEDAWTAVGEVTAHGAPRYALDVPTLFDSTAAGNGKTMFKVVAVSKGGMVFESLEGEGYSIDNLVPDAPTSLTALISGNTIEISWEAPADPDINYFKIYRGTVPGFVANEASEIGSTIDLNFSEEGLLDGTYYYKVLAVDFSGNMGVETAPVKAEVATSVVSDATTPIDFSLAQNYPNPFNPITTINFSVKEAGHVKLTVFNTLGQEIITLVDKDMTAGAFAANFSGNGLSSGEYLYRIEVTEKQSNKVIYQQIKKMILMK